MIVSEFPQEFIYIGRLFVAFDLYAWNDGIMEEETLWFNSLFHHSIIPVFRSRSGVTF